MLANIHFIIRALYDRSVVTRNPVRFVYSDSFDRNKAHRYA